jgi:hypothetical protein
VANNQKQFMQIAGKVPTTKNVSQRKQRQGEKRKVRRARVEIIAALKIKLDWKKVL